MLPQVAERGLAEFCDVFCDEGYYTADETRKILEAGLRFGLKPKIHTEQYSAIGGGQVAAELRVVSADHLNYADRDMMCAWAEAGVVGVVTPVLDFAVKHPKPFDARAMLAEGMTLALASGDAVRVS
jgi:imidazolonepropionase